MGAKRKGEITQAEMAEKAGVSVQSLRKWASLEGLDITDEAAVMERAARTDQRRNDHEDYASARTRKTRAEADLKEHELQVERGLYISAEEARSQGIRKGLAVKGIILKMPGELTPLVAGRPAGEVKKILDKYLREKLIELSAYDDPIKITAD